MKRLRNRKEKKGAVAFEALLGGGALFMTMLLGIGFFTYLYPRFMVDLEVQTLAHEVRVDGYLSVNAKDMFKENIKNRGFDNTIVFLEAPVASKDAKKIYVDVYQKANVNKKTIQKNDLNILNRSYRGEGSLIVEVTVPSKNVFLNKVSGYFGNGGKADGVMQNYYIKRVVLPEAYKEIEQLP